MENTVVAVYDNYEDADMARQELVDAGFSSSNTQINAQSDNSQTDIDTGTGSQPEESGIGHFFRSLFGRDDEVDQRGIYAESVRRGSYVLTAEPANEQQADEAIEIMNRFDPVDVAERSSHWKSQGWTGYDESAPMMTSDEIEMDRNSYAAARETDMTEEARIPVIQEDLKIGKRTVQRGGVRIIQRVTETPVNESVNLREEQVKVERRPVDKPASQADMAAFKEGTMELTESAEEAVVSKTARVVEEVVVGKEVRDRTEKITDTVRNTDVEVEQMRASGAGSSGTGTSGVMADDDQDFRQHWQTSYGPQSGRYEDYDDAYRYGSRVASSEPYKSRQWTDVEPDLRGDWESSHPGSAWEKVKDAVRYGAERVTGKTRH